jgi:intracellular septation protein A
MHMQSCMEMRYCLGMADPSEPSPTQVARMMSPSASQLAVPLVVNGVAPLVAYGLVRPHVSSDAVALTVVLVFPFADVAFTRLRRRPVEPISVIALLAVALALVATVATHGDPLALKLRSSVITACFGAGCLLSLMLARPALFHMGRAFAMASDTAHGELVDRLWEHETLARQVRRLTVLWGLGLCAQAAINVVLALVASTGTFLAGSLLVDWLGLAALLVVTTVAIHRTADDLPTQPTDAAIPPR